MLDFVSRKSYCQTHNAVPFLFLSNTLCVIFDKSLLVCYWYLCHVGYIITHKVDLVQFSE